MMFCVHIKPGAGPPGPYANDWHYPHYHGTGLGPEGTIRQGPYKLIEWFEKSICGTDGALELYNLENDPAEQNNLADSLPGLAAKMLFDLQSWRKQTDA